MKIKCKRKKRYVQWMRGGDDLSYYIINYIFSIPNVNRKFSYIHLHEDLEYSKNHAIKHFKTWFKDNKDCLIRVYSS